MKVNYDFYKGNDNYSDGEIEKDIIQYIKEYGEQNYKEIFQKDSSWPVFYHITPIRKNILNWYPFKQNSQVLEIGAGMGAITDILCEKAEHVTSVELSKQRATAIELRCKNRENLEIIVANFNDIKFTQKYDYITLIGVLEYAPLYTKTKNPFHDFLVQIKSLLKDDGKLLIAIENQYGMKYFSGVPEDHTAKLYDGINGYETKKGIRTFGKQQLKNILEECGLKYTKFYYPMPDYKLPNIIFSDDYLPDEETIKKYEPYMSNENIFVQYDEKQAYMDIIKNGKFDFFANSFFVEASSEEIETKINLENQDLIKIDESMQKFYKKHKPKQANELIKQILQEKQQVMKKNEELLRENQKVIEKNEELLNENQKIKEELNAIANSKSWKITEPLRNLRSKKRSHGK